MLLIKASKPLASPSVSVSFWYEKESWMTLNLVCTDSDSRDVDSPDDYSDITEPPIQASSSPQGQNRPGPTNQENIPVEDFLRTEVSYPVPWSTALKSQLDSTDEKDAGLDRASLKSHHGVLVHKAVEELMDSVIRTTRKAHEDKLQKEIEAEWVPRCKAWLRQQLARQEEEVRAQFEQQWLNIEGAKFRAQFLEDVEKARETLEANEKAKFEQDWNNGGRFECRKALRLRLEPAVRRELKAELKPVVLEQLRARNPPAPRPEAQRDIAGDIGHYHNTLRFAQHIGSRLRAQDSENQISEPNPLVRRLAPVQEASERLNSAVDSGLPDRPVNRQSIDTDAYNRGLFNIFSLDAPSHGPLIHHPQPIQPASRFGQDFQSRPVRNHGIVGEPIIPRRVHTLQKESVPTQSSVATRYHSNQLVPGLSTDRPSSPPAAERGLMLPPPRPAGPKPVSQPVPVKLGVQTVDSDETQSQVQQQSQDKRVQEHKEGDRNETGRVQIRQHPDSPTQPQTSNKDGIGESEILESRLKTTDSHETHREVQQQGQEVQTGNSVSQTGSVPSQKHGKKRARSVEDGSEEFDVRHDKDASQIKGAKRAAKRARLDPAQ
ncbi:MAG: hypothetical protein Q9223_000039 [Gallowayella weberi]